MVDMRVTLSGWTLDNPVIPASGTFGYGREFAELYDINILGSFSFKGTTLHPRYGNPLPRIAECTGGLLNAVGLQNPGIEHVMRHELVEMKSYYHKPVIANISGFSIDEYTACCAMADKADNVGIIEVNVSCPNVHGGGLSFVLVDEGYIKGMKVTDDGKQGVITLTLKYQENGAPVIDGLKRVSKPGLRIYTNCEDMPKVMKGLGTAIISTSKGVMTDKAARAAHVGGEVLAFVW